MSFTDHQAAAHDTWTPDAVRHVQFPRTPLGRRGYSEPDVDRFTTRLADALDRNAAEKAELRAEAAALRAEVVRLRDFYRQRGIETGQFPAAAASSTGPEPSPHAVNLMSMAQQAADQHIAEAESYVRAMLGTARRQYEEILAQAQHQADDAARRAAGAVAGEAGSSTDPEVEARVAYLRTFTEVAQVQMRSVLHSLEHELNQLSDLWGPVNRER